MISPLRRVAVLAACGSLLVSAFAASPTTTPDMAQQLATALDRLSARRAYAWETYNIEGGRQVKKDWPETSVHAGLRAIEKPDDIPQLVSPTLTRDNNHPAIRGQLHADGLCAVEAGFEGSPGVLAVRSPAGDALVQDRDGVWLPRAALASPARRPHPPPGPDSPEVIWRTCASAALNSRLPHEVLPQVLRCASNHRLQSGALVVDLDLGSAQALLGAGSYLAPRDPLRFKGTAELHLAGTELRECRLVMEWEADYPRRPEPIRQSRDLLFRFVDPSSLSVSIPAEVRQHLTAKPRSAR